MSVSASLFFFLSLSLSLYIYPFTLHIQSLAFAQEEQEKLLKEQQREESRLKALEQSEKDKQLAQQKKQEPQQLGVRMWKDSIVFHSLLKPGTIPKRKEMDLERQLQVFSQDRVTRQFGFFERKLWRKKPGNFPRLTKLEAMSDAALVASLEEAASDAALAGASVTSASDCRACVVTELIKHTLHFLAKSLMQ